MLRDIMLMRIDGDPFKACSSFEVFIGVMVEG